MITPMLTLIVLWTVILGLLILVRWGPRALARSVLRWPSEQTSKAVDRACAVIGSLGTWLVAVAVLVAVPVTIDRAQVGEQELDDAMAYTAAVLNGSRSLTDRQLAAVLDRELERAVTVERVEDSTTTDREEDDDSELTYRVRVDNPVGSVERCVTVTEVAGLAATPSGDIVDVRSAQVGDWGGCDS